MGLLSWWQDINKAGDVAEQLIVEEMSYVSDDTLAQLGTDVEASDLSLFVETAREDLNEYHERERVKVEGNWWQKFDQSVLIDEEKHPILKKFLPF